MLILVRYDKISITPAAHSSSDSQQGTSADLQFPLGSSQRPTHFPSLNSNFQPQQLVQWIQS